VDLREILSYLEAQNRAYFTTDKPGYLVEVYEQLRKLKAASVSIEWLQTNLVLRARTNPDYRILSLAPTPEALQDFAAHLGQCFGAMGVNLQRKHYPLCNDVSSALLIEYAGAQIILGGDVTSAGWRSARSKWHQRVGPCILVKASHHGSEGSYFEDAWREWQVTDIHSPTTIVTTPYRRSARLPTPAGVAKLNEHGQFFLTGAQQAPELPDGPGWAILGPILNPHIDDVSANRTDHFRCIVNDAGAVTERGWL